MLNAPLVGGPSGTLASFARSARGYKASASPFGPRPSEPSPLSKGLASEARWLDTCRHGAVTASSHRRGTEEELVRKRPFLGLLIAAVAALALIATGCGSKKSSSNTTSSSN